MTAEETGGMDWSTYDTFKPDIMEGLAERVIQSFRKAEEQPYKAKKDVLNKFKLPSNLEELNVPRMNPGIIQQSSVSEFTKRTEKRWEFLKHCFYLIHF